MKKKEKKPVIIFSGLIVYASQKILQITECYNQHSI